MSVSVDRAPFYLFEHNSSVFLQRLADPSLTNKHRCFYPAYIRRKLQLFLDARFTIPGACSDEGITVWLRQLMVYEIRNTGPAQYPWDTNQCCFAEFFDKCLLLL